MALTLRTAITANDTTFDVLGSDDLEAGDFKTIDSETVVIRSVRSATLGYGESPRYRVSVYRGSGGSRAAAHAANATLATYSGGVGGGGVTVTDGTTTVDPTTSLSLPSGSLASPGGGVAAVTVAQVFVDDDDPGAVGANNVWVQTNVGGNDDYSQIWVRNDADDGWLVIGPVVNGDGETNVLLSSPSDVAELNLTDGAGTYLTANTNLKLSAGSKGWFIENATGVHLGTANTDPALLFGVPNPQGGAGVAAPIGSLFLKTTGDLLIKTGAGDTAWSVLVRVASPAVVPNIADPASATTEDVANKVNDLLDALHTLNVVSP